MHSITWPCCVHVASHCKLHLHCLNQNVLTNLHISAFLSAAHLILRRPFRDRCLHSSFSTVRRFAAVNAKLVQKQSKIFSMIVSRSYRCQILGIITQKLETIYIYILKYFLSDMEDIHFWCHFPVVQSRGLAWQEQHESSFSSSYPSCFLSGNVWKPVTAFSMRMCSVFCEVGAIAAAAAAWLIASRRKWATRAERLAVFSSSR